MFGEETILSFERNSNVWGKDKSIVQKETWTFRNEENTKCQRF
jgi:hypothetical protein